MKFSQSSSSNSNNLIRVAKLGRLNKLIKLVRLVKVMKLKSGIMQFMSNVFNMGKGIERITLLIIASLLVCHVFACLWIVFSSFGDPGASNWMNDEIKAMSTSD